MGYNQGNQPGPGFTAVTYHYGSPEGKDSPTMPVSGFDTKNPGDLAGGKLNPNMRHVGEPAVTAAATSDVVPDKPTGTAAAQTLHDRVADVLLKSGAQSSYTRKGHSHDVMVPKDQIHKVARKMASALPGAKIHPTKEKKNLIYKLKHGQHDITVRSYGK